MTLREAYAAQSFRPHNERMDALGYHAAKITERPRRAKLRAAIRLYVEVKRERLARWIAPWIAEDE